VAKKPGKGAEAAEQKAGGYERKPHPNRDKPVARTPASELPFVNLMRGNPRSLYPDEKWEGFLQVLARTGNVKAAAEAVGIPREYTYFRRRNDDDFAQAFDEARAAGIETLETVGMDRAINGVEEPVFYQGVEVSQVTKYSDQLLMFFLQGNNDRYRRRQEITGAGGSPLNAPGAAFAGLGDEELAEMVAQQQRELTKTVE